MPCFLTYVISLVINPNFHYVGYQVGEYHTEMMDVEYLRADLAENYDWDSGTWNYYDDDNIPF